MLAIVGKIGRIGVRADLNYVPARLRPGRPALPQRGLPITYWVRAPMWAYPRHGYRRPPTLGAPPGASVEPLGELFIKLLPDGFAVLLPPAAALPALVPMPVQAPPCWQAPALSPIRSLRLSIPFSSCVAGTRNTPIRADVPANRFKVLKAW